MPITNGNIISQLISKLTSKYANKQAHTLAYWLAQWAINKPQAYFFINNNITLTTEQSQKLNTALHEHINLNKPLQYIFGQQKFLDIDIKVEPPILIPRPETEDWAAWLYKKLEQIPKDKQNFKILDLCTGTGCIALSAANKFNKANIIGLDINPQACNLANLNLKSNNIKNAKFIVSDLYSNLDPNEKFDFILSNPPYISQDEWDSLEPIVKNWEDPIALKAPQNGLEIIEKIIKYARTWLTQDRADFINLDIPRIIIEIGNSQKAAVIDIATKYSFTKAIVKKDLAGKDRFLCLY